MIGDLHATFVFATNSQAKAAWERVAKRVRWISVNRWALDPRDAKSAAKSALAITIMCEQHDERGEPQFQKARMLLRKGTEIDTPEVVISALRAKREQLLLAGGGRRLLRNPSGHVMDKHGRDHGPLRRPQG